MAYFEYYPGQERLLNLLGMEAILVGSARYKPLTECKDIDFVVSPLGMRKMQAELGRYLSPCEEDWWLYIPGDPKEPIIELFGRICRINDPSKWSNRITYEEAIQQELVVKTLYGVEMFALL